MPSVPPAAKLYSTPYVVERGDLCMKRNGKTTNKIEKGKQTLDPRVSVEGQTLPAPLEIQRGLWDRRSVLKVTDKRIQYQRRDYNSPTI